MLRPALRNFSWDYNGNGPVAKEQWDRLFKNYFLTIYIKNMDFIERLNLEKQQLDEKIEKLSTFISEAKCTYNDLSNSHKSLLKTQLLLMKSYSEVLNNRLEDLKFFK